MMKGSSAPLRLSFYDAGLAIVFILVLAGMVYGATSTSVFGHSSDQVKFLVSLKSVDCTSSVSGNCTATCDQSPGNITTALSGTCISDTPGSWNYFGSWKSASGIESDSWHCSNSLHSPGETLQAIAVCMKGGQ
jgi:hypothetical protein